MINYVYQLVSPQVFSVKYENIKFENKVIVKPEYMAICHADQRYYLGQRDHAVLQRKLPMALIHECSGRVVYDPTGTWNMGDPVVMIPNVPAPHEEHIYENYAKGSGFLSSGVDGFLREYVDVPADRVVSAKGVPLKDAAVTEFVSVAMHAASRMNVIAHCGRECIGIWGDGSLAFVVANVVKKIFPDSRLVIIGKNIRKLVYFSFADATYLADSLPKNLSVDHAFECCGGDGSSYAIDDIIRYISPQGTVVLMGVTENKVAINTRNILEKGLTFVGSSRSGREDFENAMELMRSPLFNQRLQQIIYEDKEVSSIDDIHRVFQTDLNTPFKTVFKWNM
ncbi:alcohol dehydrogenase catalytic domain-containing protein [Bariatricus sp. HCP28S3_A7]|uniref:alcohol dehydrogenase catalytic domain-containing protein n=1 Tax=Bariatricus sp. HCP28S3_A7 TaxID=3438894 RepID=UPI003F8C9657